MSTICYERGRERAMVGGGEGGRGARESERDLAKQVCLHYFLTSLYFPGFSWSH